MFMTYPLNSYFHNMQLLQQCTKSYDIDNQNYTFNLPGIQLLYQLSFKKPLVVIIT